MLVFRQRIMFNGCRFADAGIADDQADAFSWAFCADRENFKDSICRRRFVKIIHFSHRSICLCALSGFDVCNVFIHAVIDHGLAVLFPL
ncbi:MAG: hypothetical protein RIB59_11055, partial [Rhodospirillales bacterium]